MKDVTVEESPVGPVVRPPEDTELVVLYLHGNQDGPEPALEAAGRLALLAGATVVCPRYRGAFPAALIDAHSGYSYCQAAGPVAVVGEGIGGALATAMLVQLRDSEATSPRRAVLVSALLDLTLDSKSLQFNASPTFDLGALRSRIADYARGTPLTDSHLSPLYANLHGLPPMALLVAGTDPMLDDSLAFTTRAARSGVALDLRVWPDAASFHAQSTHVMAEFLAARHAGAEAGAAA
ncbi:alpha/beta hydrolase fold domain-containing protein [Amycolatopsis acidicola]|uniref:alpha/beta hydrolase fold domain-containing protein n=1 Tax=Amycolatopsis acidicola TaxID=2596893 RepID=UPI001AA033B3|nr:alpha/beta hydrolase [Amycolatopsis acidicola]